MRTATRVAGLLLLLPLAGGCAGPVEPTAQEVEAAGEPAASTQPSPSPPTEPPSPSSSTAPIPPPAPDLAGVQFTAPGTVLALGEEAVVPVVTDVVVGAIGLTVTRIEQGDPAALAAAPGFAIGYDGFTPYYVRVTITHEAGGELAGSYADGSDMTTTLSTGGPAPQTTNATIGPCENVYAASGLNAPGLSYETCLTGLAPPGTSVTGVRYTGTTDLGAPAPGAPDYAYSGLDWR